MVTSRLSLRTPRGHVPLSLTDFLRSRPSRDLRTREATSRISYALSEVTSPLSPTLSRGRVPYSLRTPRSHVPASPSASPADKHGHVPPPSSLAPPPWPLLPPTPQHCYSAPFPSVSQLAFHKVPLLPCSHGTPTMLTPGAGTDNVRRSKSNVRLSRSPHTSPRRSPRRIPKLPSMARSKSPVPVMMKGPVSAIGPEVSSSGQATGSVTLNGGLNQREPPPGPGYEEFTGADQVCPRQGHKRERTCVLMVTCISMDAVRLCWYPRSQSSGWNQTPEALLCTAKVGS